MSEDVAPSEPWYEWDRREVHSSGREGCPSIAGVAHARVASSKNDTRESKKQGGRGPLRTLAPAGRLGYNFKQVKRPEQLRKLPMSQVLPEYVPFGRPHFTEEEVGAVSRVLRSGWIGMGPEVQAFEDELASWLGAARAVTANSCTSALFLSLLVHGIGPGDEVICPSLTWCATANSALYLGATPVFCDVSRETFSQTVESVLEKVTARTKAVVVVHYGGLAFDVGALRERLPAGIPIVEDAAHALGARYPGGGPVGSSGNLVCFSFYANKNLCTGEGGAIVLGDGEVADRLASLRQNAYPINAWRRFTDRHVLLSEGLTELGYKMNYTDLQAALGRVQLRRQAELAAKRLDVALIYDQALAATGCTAQQDITHPGHARHLYALCLPVSVDRMDLLGRCRARNAGMTIHYAPLHLMPLYQQGAEPLPATEDLARRLLTLPISASITAAEARAVANIFVEEFNRS